jgi:putative flippase GtrA
MFGTILKGSQTHAQFIRYFIVAAAGLAIDFATVIFTKQELHFYYLVATFCGFILGLIVTYVLSNRFVFGAPKGSRQKTFLLFSVVGVVGLGILSLLMWLLTGKLGINYIISKALATIVVFIWNFIARKTLYDPQKIELPYEL